MKTLKRISLSIVMVLFLTGVLTFAQESDADNAYLSELNKAIAIDPKDDGAYLSRGVFYDSTGQFDRAISDYDKAIEINPKLIIAYNNRGNSYLRKGEFDQAINNYNKAIELNPNFDGSYLNRGHAYSTKGQVDQAISDYTKAIEINPRGALAYQNRGASYLVRLGDKVKACADYKKACELGMCEHYNTAKRQGHCP